MSDRKTSATTMLVAGIMLGAFTAYGAWSFLGINPLLTLPISMAVLFAIGMVIGHFLVRSVALRGLMPSISLLYSSADWR